MLESPSLYFTQDSYSHPLHGGGCADHNPVRACNAAGKARLKPFYASWAELQEAVLLQCQAVAAEHPAAE